MLSAHALRNGRLDRLPDDADASSAIWIDLLRPTEDEVARMAGQGVAVPTLADMEEIEISNRLYREAGIDVMTVMLPGRDEAGQQISAPVTFLLSQELLITVRHHAPRAFDTFAARADRSSAGCGSATRLFLGLVEEIVARQADLLEGAGRELDRIAGEVFGETPGGVAMLQAALRDIGRQGEMMAKIRLALLTMERMLSVFSVWNSHKGGDHQLGPLTKALMRDINALEVHTDFLNSRVSLTSDTTLGMINLDENAVVRALSVVAALFLPPTLIASVYGMNFAHMPELDNPYAYPAALALMALTAGLTWLWFRLKGWL